VGRIVKPFLAFLEPLGGKYRKVKRLGEQVKVATLGDADSIVSTPDAVRALATPGEIPGGFQGDFRRIQKYIIYLMLFRGRIMVVIEHPTRG
jgi:hypothetical protein